MNIGKESTEEGSFCDEVRSSDNKSAGRDEGAHTETSRNKSFFWKPIILPSGREWPIAQRVSNLRVSIIEQKGTGAGKITTLYAASGTFFNGTQDDKTHKSCEWTIYFKNKDGITIDSFKFYLDHFPCSYNGEVPFSIPPTLSAFNFFDVIEVALGTGVKPAGYQGGC